MLHSFRRLVRLKDPVFARFRRFIDPCAFLIFIKVLFFGPESFHFVVRRLSVRATLFIP